MSEISLSGKLPAEWAVAAMQLDTFAAVVADYCQRPRAADSVAMSDLAAEHRFAALPWKSPLTETILLPVQLLGISHDHLVALAGVIRTPRTVLASMTILRTLIVAASTAAYMADTVVDVSERVRRSVNHQLAALTEQMRMVGRGNTEFAEYDKRRNAVVDASRGCGWKPNAPSRYAIWPQDWWLGDRPLGEGKLIDQALTTSEPKKVGETLYRWLCSGSHAQIHGLVSFVRPDSAVSRGDGTSSVHVTMSHQRLLQFCLFATGTITLAMDRCVSYYGWSPDLWRAEALPMFQAFRQQLGLPST